jgi:hypothetical protein
VDQRNAVSGIQSREFRALALGNEIFLVIPEEQISGVWCFFSHFKMSLSPQKLERNLEVLAYARNKKN